MTSTVAVIGGGYGGIAVAKGLDGIADVTLVDPRDTFVHNVAALRGVVDPAWVDQMFLPYDRLLERGRVLRDLATRVQPGTVGLASGAELSADYIVLATGSGYPFPAKIETVDTGDSKDALHSVHAELAKADRVLLLGAGPVGIEFAGEIKATWPEKVVTIVDPCDDVVSGGYSAEFRDELRRQLHELGVELVLGASLRSDPESPVGRHQPVSVTTTAGTALTADIWFRCHGVTPHSDYLIGALASARRPSGEIAVTEHLLVEDQDRVFAIGDAAATSEPKMAMIASKHADVVTANIRSLIEGADELTSHVAEDPMIVLPIGPSGGASYIPQMGGLVDTDMTIQMKSSHLFVGHYMEILNLAIPSAETMSSATART